MMEVDRERNEQTQPPVKKRRLAVSSLLPIIALGLSLVSFYVSRQASRDVSRLDVIKTEYGLFHELAQLQLQNPLMTHLFTVTNQSYEATVAQVKVSSAALSPPERAKLLLQERAFAHYLFTTYEETYYLWQQAMEGGDKRREQLAHDDLAYYNAAFCNNPRLLWYWDADGGKLLRAFADDLQAYYKDNVVNDCQTSEDTAGPFGH